MRILYLEDNPNDAELTLRALNSYNPKTELIIAGDVHTALEIIHNHPPEHFDIFLSDFELPDGDAIQFLETIHQRGMYQPVVIVTGNDDPNVRSRTLQQGVAGFIHKEGKYLGTLPEKIEKIHKSYQDNRKRQSVIHVLYAEQNPVDAELTQMHFASHAAHIVLQVVSSIGELEKFCRSQEKNSECDVILVDMDIQKEGDIPLLKKLKTEWKIEQPVILLTSPGDDMVTVQALQLGAENCVVKNIGYFQLLPAIIEVAFTKSKLVKEQKASFERERLFRLMTENARDIVFRLRFSPDLGFDYISTAVKRLTGYSPEEFYQDPSLLMELVDPEDFTRLQEMLAEPTHFTKPILLRWRARDGHILWVEAKGSFIHDSSGKFVALEGIARDISERIQFESALQAENARRQELETIINKSPVIVVRWKPKFGKPLDYISENISNLGYKAKDFLDGKILYEDIVHPEDAKQLADEVTRHAQVNDAQYRMRYRLITKIGETRWVDDLTWVVKDEQGTPLYHQGIVTDITEQLRAEEKRKESEQLYSSVVKASPDLVTIVDQEGKIVFLSPKAKELFRLDSEEEWIGHTFYQILAPASRDLARKNVQSFIKGNPSASDSYEAIRKDGTSVWIEIRSSLLKNPDNTPTGIISIITDVTLRRETQQALQSSEEKYHRIVDTASEGIWVTNENFIISFSNPQMSEMLGYSVDEMVSRKSDFCTFPEDRNDVLRIEEERRHGKSHQYERRYRRKDGSTLWTIVSAKPMLDEANHFLGTFAMFTDITARKEAEEEQNRRILRNQDERQAITQLALHPAVSSGDFEPALRHITETVAKVVGVERVSIWMYTKGEDGILCDDIYQSTPNQHSSGLMLKARDYPTYFESLRAGRAIAAHDARNDPRTLEFTDTYLLPNGIMSMLDSAIRVRGKMVGVVCFEQVGEPRHWHQDEITFGGEIADQVAQVLLNLERKNAEKAIKESENRYRSIFEQAHDAIFILDENKLVECNHQTEILFGWKKDKLLGRTPPELSPQIQLDGTDSDEIGIQKFELALQGKPQLFEWVHLKKDGTPFEVEAKLNRIEFGGKAMVQAMVRDITERKKAMEELLVSEEKYRGLFENSIVGISQTSLDGKLISANNAFARMYGYKNTKEMIKEVSNVVQFYADPRERDEVLRLLIKNGALSSRELTMKRRDGSQFHILLAVREIRDAQNNLIFYQSEHVDITERKLAEKGLYDAEQRYRGLFEDSPISLWEEDFSEVKLYLDALKKRGVKDFHRYLQDHPAAIQECLSRIRIIDVNRATLKLYGAARKDELLKNLDRVMMEESNQWFIKEIEEIAEEKTEFRWEGLNRTLAGKNILVDLHWAAAPGFEDTLSKVIISIEDITERKQFENSLKDSEQSYRTLAENLPGIVFRLHLQENNRMQWLNEMLLPLTGYTEEETAKEFTRWEQKTVFPQDYDRILAFTDEAIISKKSYVCEYRIHKKDGEIRYFSERGQPVYDQQGKPLFLDGIILDVTERHEIEAAMRESETRYRGLFEDSPISLWEEDFSGVKQFLDSLKKKGVRNFRRYVTDHPEVIFECAKRVKVLDVNRATVQLYKASSKDDLLTNPDKVFCEESLLGVVEEMLHIAEGNYDFEGETFNQTIDGQKININLHWTVAPGYEDSLSRVIISITDITAKKKAEEELRLSEEKYRELFAHMQSGVAVYQAVDDGSDFVFLDFNDRAEEIEGIKRKAVLGRRVTQVFPGAVQLGILEILKRVWLTGKAEFLPASLYKDERERESWREYWIYRLPDGKIVAIYSDVSQRKQTEDAIRISEARYRSLVENQTAVISRTDLDGNLTFANDEFCRVFGEKREKLLGNRIQTTILPEDQHLVEKAIKESMEPPYHSQLENRNITAQGVRWFRWENSAILDSKGNIKEMQYAGWDITEQKNSQMALQRRDKILEAVSFTATRLLEAADWKKQAPIILEKLGKSAGVDRVYLLKYPESHQHFELAKVPENLIEWTAPGVGHKLQDNQLPRLVEFSKAMDHWKMTLKRGEVIVGVPDRLPKEEQDLLAALGIRGIVLVPILLEGNLWGLMGFDQINADHHWDATELEALKTFADTFASAIQRNKAYTDLLDRETRLHAILEASKDAILVALKDMTVYANTAFRKLFGLSQQDDLEDIPISSLIAPEDRQRYLDISEARQNGKPAPTHYELKALKKNGTEFDLEVYVSTYELLGETYNLAILRDITDKKKHDRELRALSTVSTALRKARSREEMYPIMVDELAKVMQAVGGLITLEDLSTGDFVVKYSNGELAHQEGFRVPAGKGIAAEIVRTRKPYLSHNLKADPRFLMGNIIEHCKEAVIYPMIAQRKVIGTLLVSRERPFDKSEIKVIGSITEMAANAIQRSTLYEQTESRLQKLIALRQIDTAISSTLDLQKIMDIILTSSQKFLNVDAADILLHDESTGRLKYAYGVGFRTQLMNGFSVSIGKGWAGKAAQTRSPVFIPDLKKVSDQLIKPALKVEKLVSYYAVPLITNNQVKGVMECLTRSPLQQDQDWVEFINLLAGQAAIAINSAQLFDEIKHSNVQIIRAYDETIEGWSRAMDIRDKETEGHTQRVVELTLRLARAMGIPEEQLIHVKRGTLLHDIGKLVVPDTILFKPAALTDLEWRIMKKHPLNAYNMLASVDYLKPALDIPYCHHEHWDGSGYPRGLKGEEIPFTARIFSVVDIWDALLSNRPYRPAWSREKTIAYIKSRSGEDLDPKVVKVFLKIISETN